MSYPPDDGWERKQRIIYLCTGVGLISGFAFCTVTLLTLFN